MRARLERPFQPLTRAALARIGGHLMVYDLADDQGRVLFVGFAGGRSRLGLRGELGRKLARRRGGTFVNLDPSDEQRLLIDLVRRFVREEIVPLEHDLDPDEESLPPDVFPRLVKKTRAMGLCGLDVPEDLGGPGIDIVTRTLLAIEMAQHRAGRYTPCYGVCGVAGLAQLFEANEDQRARYLQPVLRGEKHGCFALMESSGGSDPARAIRTSAVRDGDDWVLDGEKTFISGADRADFTLVLARNDPSKGRGGVTCFIVDTDTPGFRVRRAVYTPRSAHYPTEIELDKVRVPHANVLGKVGGGFSIANERLALNRIRYAAGCIGVAIRAHELAISYARSRETFGAPLATRRAVPWTIVDNEVDIRQSRGPTLEAAHRAKLGMPFRAEQGWRRSWPPRPPVAWWALPCRSAGATA